MDNRNNLIENVIETLSIKKYSYEQELKKLHDNPSNYITQVDEIINCVNEITKIKLAIVTYLEYISPNNNEDNLTSK